MSDLYDYEAGLDESRAAEALRSAARALDQCDYYTALKLVTDVASAIAALLRDDAQDTAKEATS